MRTTFLQRTMAIALIGLALAGCKPSEPPPDLVKTQREALDSTKAVEGQMQQAQERLKAVEDTQK